jgi:hypothetical protein
MINDLSSENTGMAKTNKAEKLKSFNFMRKVCIYLTGLRGICPSRNARRSRRMVTAFCYITLSCAPPPVGAGMTCRRRKYAVVSSEAGGILCGSWTGSWAFQQVLGSLKERPGFCCLALLMKWLWMVSWMALPLAAGAETDVRPAMERAERFGRESGNLMLRHQLSPFWSADGKSFAYRVNSGPGEHQFFQVDLKSGEKRPAFDHVAMAAALKAKAGKPVNAKHLPIDSLEPGADPNSVLFRAFGEGWRFDAGTGSLEKAEVTAVASTLLSPHRAMRTRTEGGRATSLTVENGTGGEIELLWREGFRQTRSYGKIAAGESRTFSTYSGHVWIFADASGKHLAGVVATEASSLARVTGKVESREVEAKPREVSPDGTWRAVIRDHNVVVQAVKGGEELALTKDGSAENHYRGPFFWSPDSRKLAAFQENSVETRKVHIVESSPKDQLQPKLKTLNYPKPGDELPKAKPCLFDIDSRRLVARRPAVGHRGAQGGEENGGPISDGRASISRE